MPPSVVPSIASSGHHSSYSRSASNARSPSFHEDPENFHRVEFEAPFSAEADSEQDRLQKAQQGRFSIDYSLELERELAMESPPDTPAHHATAHPASIHSSHSRADSRVNDVSPDPEVLAHIVTQLRISLADMTKERDELLKMLATASTQEANAKDALQVMTDKATEAEEELTILRKKTKEDEDQIALLRTKVEESRYDSHLQMSLEILFLIQICSLSATLTS
jgi:chromosome segregation ATPase